MPAPLILPPHTPPPPPPLLFPHVLFLHHTVIIFAKWGWTGKILTSEKSEHWVWCWSTKNQIVAETKCSYISVTPVPVNLNSGKNWNKLLASVYVYFCLTNMVNWTVNTEYFYSFLCISPYFRLDVPWNGYTGHCETLVSGSFGSFVGRGIAYLLSVTQRRGDITCRWCLSNMWTHKLQVINILITDMERVIQKYNINLAVMQVNSVNVA